ncbi:MAG: hypothetical protein AUI96_04370 [Nitrospirae bacterium 13_1_40CM_3_62_11]|nr:MAG: hypothetical protein AUI96_04370 [Nitrospirae bacterium 13_1_40CM_3_62_11]
MLRAFDRLTLTSLQEKLARITSSGRVIPEIDGLRFIAIGSVVLYHLSAFVAAGFTRPLVTRLNRVGLRQKAALTPLEPLERLLSHESGHG